MSDHLIQLGDVRRRLLLAAPANDALREDGTPALTVALPHGYTASARISTHRALSKLAERGLLFSRPIPTVVGADAVTAWRVTLGQRGWIDVDDPAGAAAFHIIEADGRQRQKERFTLHVMRRTALGDAVVAQHEAELRACAPGKRVVVDLTALHGTAPPSGQE